MACKLTAPPWNSFLQPGILNHDHEHVPYFPAKTAQNCRQRDTVAYFWTAPTAWFQGGTGPKSEDSPCPSVTSYWCSAEGFYTTVFEHRTPWKTALKALGIKPQFSHQFFMGRLTEPMMSELCYKFWLTFYCMHFEKTSSKFGSTTRSGRFQPTWPWVFNDVLQNLSTVATRVVNS